MLDGQKIEYTYREYREQPLDAGEIREILGLLELEAHELLRPREAAAAGLNANLPEEHIIRAMCEQPTLVQRPILTDGTRAVLARPADLLTAFLAAT